MLGRVDEWLTRRTSRPSFLFLRPHVPAVHKVMETLLGGDPSFDAALIGRPPAAGIWSPQVREKYLPSQALRATAVSVSPSWSGAVSGCRFYRQRCSLAPGTMGINRAICRGGVRAARSERSVHTDLNRSRRPECLQRQSSCNIAAWSLCCKLKSEDIERPRQPSGLQALTLNPKP